MWQQSEHDRHTRGLEESKVWVHLTCLNSSKFENLPHFPSNCCLFSLTNCCHVLFWNCHATKEGLMSLCFYRIKRQSTWQAYRSVFKVHCFWQKVYPDGCLKRKKMQFRMYFAEKVLTALLLAPKHGCVTKNMA